MYTPIHKWIFIGKAPKGPQPNGELLCLGGCGGVIGIIPSEAEWANQNLTWCSDCAKQFRSDTGDDPCYPRDIREIEVAELLRKEGEK